MARPWTFETFEPPRVAGFGISFTTDEELEEVRLAAFENGYRAGWDDSAAAHIEEQATIGSELSANLQEFSFSYAEARASVLRDLEALLRGIVDKVLPAGAQGVLGAMLVEAAMEASRDNSDRDFEIVVHPCNGPALHQAIDAAEGLSVQVVTEETLGTGQAFLRLGDTEQKFDIDHLLSRLTDAVAEFFEPEDHPEMRLQHG